MQAWILGKIFKLIIFILNRSMACNIRCSLNCVAVGTTDSSKCVECDSSELFI